MKDTLTFQQVKTLYHLALNYLPGKPQAKSIYAFLGEESSLAKMWWAIDQASHHSPWFRSYVSNT